MVSGFLVVDTIGPHLDILAAGAAAAVMARMEEGAQEVEAYAKFNAPWTDQTGMAREGLFTQVYEDGGDIVLELAHSVDYGIWLELKNDGEYAIILPTLEALGPKIVHQSGGAVMGIESNF